MANLPPIRGPRAVHFTAVAKGQVRIDVQSDEDELDRACLILPLAEFQRLIRDAERTAYDAARMD